MTRFLEIITDFGVWKEFGYCNIELRISNKLHQNMHNNTAALCPALHTPHTQSQSHYRIEGY